MGPLPPGPDDLTALDAFLLSDDSPDECMMISDLDGFLTGVIVGPDMILPSEWLPAIWGGEEPAFADINQAQSILGTIMGRYNQIASGLDTDPMQFEPLFQQTRSGHVIVSDWAAGFLDAIKLRPKSWEPLLRHKRAHALILPLVALGADDPDDIPFGLGPFAQRDIDVWQLGAVKMIPLCVDGIHNFWLDYRQRSAPGVRRQRPTSGARGRRGR